jgi:6-phosphogluconolactonase
MADVRIVTDESELARVGAVEFLDRLDLAGREGRPFRVALAGGRTPRGVYEELAAAHVQGGRAIDWERTHVFFGDERAVPPDHPDSNFGMARRALFSRVPLPEENIHRVPAEAPDPEAAAEAYEREIRSVFTPASGEWPRFDLVLLGMGADGHVASLFPDSAALLESHRIVTSTWVEPLRARRFTLTLPVINSAACVLFLVTGAGKAPVLRDVLQGGGGAARYPAQLVRPDRGTVVWLVDRDAAGKLTHHA